MPSYILLFLTSPSFDGLTGFDCNIFNIPSFKNMALENGILFAPRSFQSEGKKVLKMQYLQ